MEPICILKDLYKIVYQFEKDFQESHALTINEAMLLCCLKEGGCKTAGTLSEYIGLSNSRVSKVIHAVESKGFISRQISPEDKRQMLFALTEAGKEKVAQMQGAELKIDDFYRRLSVCLENGQGPEMKAESREDADSKRPTEG